MSLLKLKNELARLQKEEREKKEREELVRQISEYKFNKRYGKYIKPVKRVGSGLKTIGIGLGRIVKKIPINKNYYK